VKKRSDGPSGHLRRTIQEGADYEVRLKEFGAMDSYKRSDYVQSGGWDKRRDQEQATWGVSSACVAEIEGLVKGEASPAG